MIVHCDQCRTNFRLDDSKVKAAGVKVRCSKCRNVFTVFPETPKEDSDFEDMLKGFGPAADGGDNPVAQGEVPSTAPVSSPFPEEVDALPARGEDWGEPVGYDSSFDEESGGDGAQGDSPDGGGQLQGSSFDFSTLLDEPPPRATEMQQPEFPGTDIFGTAEPDFPTDQPEGDGVPGHVADLSANEPDPFFLNASQAEASFGEQPEAQTEDPAVEAASPVPEFGDAFMEALPEDPVNAKPEFARPASEQVIAAEPPSLPLPSRRREHSIFPVLITVISIAFLLLLAAGGLFFLKEGPQGLERIGLGAIATWAGLGSEERGTITVRALSGAFMANADAGEIFVVTGEAVNGFGKPRAGIQVRGLLYGEKGEVLVRQVAYCGNILTQDQLKTLPPAKIETAINNQFGDSLANLGVDPGKAIPFVIVFTNVPANAADYGVEVVGSTVAGK